METLAASCCPWNRIGVRLATNPNVLLRKEDDVCREEGIVEGIEVQSGSEWLRFARWTEEGTDPDEVGTVLGVREFYWANLYIPAKPPTDRPSTPPRIPNAAPKLRERSPTSLPPSSCLRTGSNS